MKIRRVILMTIMAFGLLLPFHSISLSDENENPEQKQKAMSIRDSQKEEIDKEKREPFRLFSYQPPSRGIPGGRIGGGTRTETGELPRISVLAPDHTGLTTRAQPALFWYLSDVTAKPIEFTLNIEEEGKTLIHEKIRLPCRKGINRLSLADLGATLSPHKNYTWFISMILDPDQPSKDVFSGGAIRRIPPSEALQEKLDPAGSYERARIFAEEGIWYDAIAALSDLIREDPDTEKFREQRARLLEQVGVAGAADFDRGK